MKCSDCHNPHGGFETKQTKLSVGLDAACIKCHSNKAGPFVFEHAPLKTEGCTACHTPHGSANPKLLKRAQVRQLCLECHTGISEELSPQAPAFTTRRQCDTSSVPSAMLRSTDLIRAIACSGRAEGGYMESTFPKKIIMSAGVALAACMAFTIPAAAQSPSPTPSQESADSGYKVISSIEIGAWCGLRERRRQQIPKRPKLSCRVSAFRFKFFDRKQKLGQPAAGQRLCICQRLGIRSDGLVPSES